MARALLAMLSGGIVVVGGTTTTTTQSLGLPQWDEITAQDDPGICHAFTFLNGCTLFISKPPFSLQFEDVVKLIANLGIVWYSSTVFVKGWRS